MPNELGFYDSPGERLRRERYQQTRDQVLDTFLPMAVEGLGEAAASTDQSLTELSQAQNMLNLQPPRIRPRPLLNLQEPEGLTGRLEPPRQLAPPPMDATGAGLFGPVLHPRFPGAVAQGLLRGAEAEVEFGRPATERIGGFAGEVLGEEVAPTTARLLGLSNRVTPFGIPGAEQAAERFGLPVPPSASELLSRAGVPEIVSTERGGEIGAAIGKELAPEALVLSNLVPIPIVDDVLRVLAKGVPLAGQLLKAEGRMATRAQLQELAAGARRLLATTADPADRQLLTGAIEALERGERPLAGAAAAPELPAFPEPIREPTETTVPAMGRHLAGETLTPEEFAQVQRLGGDVPLTRTRIPTEIEPPLGEADAFGARIDNEYVGGRDVVGEALDRELLPTQRTVEARSARLTPQERAANAATANDVKFPLRSFADVMKDWGTRFQQNIFTKMDDLLGRRSPLQVKVREAMVRSHIYRAVEGERMRNAAMDWIGRYQDVLGVSTLRNRGVATRVPLREGAKVPPELAGRLDDILAHPEDYVMSPEQKAAFDEIEDIFTQVMHQEQAHGVDVDELLDAYWTRIVINAPANEPTTQIRSRLGTSPWFTKQRAFPDLRQGHAAGYRYADPLTALEHRMSAAAETIGNQVAVDEVKRLGQVPSEAVHKTARDALAKAQAEYQAARRVALKTGSSQDKAAAEVALTALDESKRVVRAEAIRVSQKKPVRFGRLVDADVAQELDRFIQATPESLGDDAFRILRTLKINADYSSAGLQNWNTFWRNPVGWAKAFALGGQSLAREPYSYVVRNADVIDEAARFAGVRTPTEFLLGEGGSAARKLGRAPVIRESQRIFEWNIFIAQVERWKGVRRSLLRPDGTMDVDAALDMGAVLRKQSGTNLQPGLTTRQLNALSKTWFAPQFTAGMNAAFVEPATLGLRAGTRGGPAHRESVRTFASAFGGAAGLTVAGTLATTGKLPNMDDPDKAGFWGIPSGGGFAYPFGPYQPLIVAISRTARAATAIGKGEKPSVRDLQAWPRYVTGKASIPARFILRASEAMGIPVEAIQGQAFTRPELFGTGRGLLDWMLQEVAPIGPQQVIQGVRADAPITGLEALGGRTTIETASQELRRIVEEKARAGEFGPEKQANPEYNPDVDWLRVEQNPELIGLRDQARKDAISRGFESSKDADKRRQFLAQQEIELGLPDIAARVLGGDLAAAAQFARIFQDYEGDRAIASALDFFDADERKRESEVGQAYDDWASIGRSAYWDADLLEYDYGAYWTDKDAAFEKIRTLDSNIADAIEARTVAQNPQVAQVEREFKKARLLQRELRNTIQKYDGISTEDKREVDRFLRTVRIARERQKDQYGPDSPNVPTMAEAIGIIGEGMSPLFISQAQALQSSSARENLLSAEYVAFVVNNADVLFPFYPELNTDTIGRIRTP